jgi:ADP-heptose:LPS heptosyltransferase
MRSVYVTRYAAFGDHIHSSHLPRLLKEHAGFDRVVVEYNLKGLPIYSHNPFIDEHIVFDPHTTAFRDYPVSILAKRHAEVMRRGGYDRHIDLWNSIERAAIAMEDMSEYYLSTEERRARYGAWNYYDQVTRFAGYPEHVGMRGELYFTPEQEAQVRDIYARFYAERFVVIANLSGTSKHKLFYEARPILTEFLRRHPDAVCLLFGDENCREHLAFEGERVFNRCGNWNDAGEHTGGPGYPFKQAMLMTKHADLVIGAESGLMVAATLLGAPTVQLMTAASVKNHGGDFKNDASLQSPAACSPCHKGPYDYLGCPTFSHLGIRYPVCVRFEQAAILNRMEEVYDRRRAGDPVGAAAMSALR